MKISFEILGYSIELQIIRFLKTKPELYKTVYEALPKPPVSFSKPAGWVIRYTFLLLRDTVGAKLRRNSKFLSDAMISTPAIKSCSGEERTLQTMRPVVDKPSRTGSNHSKKGWASQRPYYIQCDKRGTIPSQAAQSQQACHPHGGNGGGPPWRGGRGAVKTVSHPSQRPPGFLVKGHEDHGNHQGEE